jgi:hypothetical protein
MWPDRRLKVMNALLQRLRPLAGLTAAAALLSLTSACGTDNPTSGEPVDADDGGPSGGVSSSTLDPEPTDGGAATAAAGVEPPQEGVYGVVTYDGRPVGGAMIQPDPGPENTAPERDSFATSAANGSYGLGLTPGAWDITISADGFDPVTLHVTVEPDSAVEADAALSRDG